MYDKRMKTKQNIGIDQDRENKFQYMPSVVVCDTYLIYRADEGIFRVKNSPIPGNHCHAGIELIRSAIFNAMGKVWPRGWNPRDRTLPVCFCRI